MVRHPPAPADSRRILDLARRDRAAAGEAIARLSVEAQVALVCETPLARRGEVLDLLDEPDKLIPHLPEAELCFTVKAIGLGDAAWILQHASGEQLASCVDLDAWSEDAPDRVALASWLDALLAAGDEALLRAARTLDPELLVLALGSRIEVFVDPGGDDWQPPRGAQSLDSQFHFRARAEGDDLASVRRLLSILFEQDYWLYFRLMQGVIWELVNETEEWARRWRTGRLQDLGFPPRAEAVAIYALLEPEQRTALPEEERDILVGGEFELPIWLPELPVAADTSRLVFRAAARLEEGERRAFFYALVSLANRVAVAERLSLADAESIPVAIEKAADLASAGLELLAREHGLDAAEVLRRVRLSRLFQIGVNLRGLETLPGEGKPAG